MGQKQRLRAERRRLDNQNLSVKFTAVDPENEEGGVEIEVGDIPQDTQTEDGLEQVIDIIDDEEDTGEVQASTDEEDPLAVLQRQHNELKAAKEKAGREAQEAIRRAQDYETRLEAAAKEREEAGAQAQERAQQYETQLHDRKVAGYTSQKAALEHAYASEDLKLGNAKRVYAEALRNGDYDAAAEANAEIARVTNVMTGYANSYHGIEAEERALAAEAEERAKAPPKKETPAETQHTPSQAQQSDPFEAALATMHPNVAAWAREHKDDIIKPERQRLAFAADAMALAKGYAAGSDEYLDFMDEAMDYFADDGRDPEPAPPPPLKQNGRRVAQPAKRPAAAPASRATSSGGKVKVFLSEWDQQQARALGYTDEYYAKNFKAKANDGQITQAQAGGRMMSRYTA